MIDRQQAESRIEKLRTIINDYRYHYHVLDESIMSESAADSLKHELTLLEEEYPDLITPDSPSQRVAGKALDKFVKVEHKFPMMSLQDVFDESEISAWITRIEKLAGKKLTEFFVDTKMDGLACSIIYRDGIFEQAITRGDGRVGEDVSLNVRTIKNVPLSLRKSEKFHKLQLGRTEIRGEIVMYKQDFINLNKKRKQAGEPEFMNPRNLSAGTIRQLDPKLVSERPLHFVAYDMLRENQEDVPSYEFAYQAMRDLGISANIHAKVLSGIKNLMEYINFWQIKREDLAFNMVIGLKLDRYSAG